VMPNDKSNIGGCQKTGLQGVPSTTPKKTF